MRLEVPFYKQETQNECGLVALQMVLEFLDKPYNKEELTKLIDNDKSGLTWTLGLAKAAAYLGFKVEFFTSFLGVDPNNYNLQFYKEKADNFSDSQKKVEKLKGDCLKLGVLMQEKRLSLEEILYKLNENCIPIIIADFAKIRGIKQSKLHFSPIVGYDDKNVYIHDSGLNKPSAYLPILKKIFDKARKSPGTDEDIIFIYRKKE